MHEKRQHVRTELRGHIKLMHERFGDRKVEMRDLSDGGIFVFVDGDLELAVGDVLKVQSLDIEDAPVLDAEVVRVEARGAGLKFIEG